MRSQVDRIYPLIIFFGVTLVVSTALEYARGEDFSGLHFHLLGSADTLLTSMLAWYMVRIAGSASNRLYKIMPYIFPVLDVVRTSVFLAYARPFYNHSVIQVLISSVLAAEVLLFSLLVRLAYKFLIELRPAASQAQIPLGKEVDSNAEDSKMSSEAPVSSRDLIAHTSVTRSVYRRSEEAGEVAKFSMIVMIVLVLVGGGASVGLWFMGHLDRVRSLELERSKLIGLSKEMEGASTAAPEKFAKELAEVRQFIRANYGQQQTYQDLLARIDRSAQTSWPDIAIRATVAILTLFLVQIFFSVYKYSQHLGNLLAAKAEALELIAADEKDRSALRKEMINLVKEGVPGFGGGPNTPLQDAIEILQKMKDIKGA